MTKSRIMSAEGLRLGDIASGSGV